MEKTTDCYFLHPKTACTTFIQLWFSIIMCILMTHFNKRQGRFCVTQNCTQNTLCVLYMQHLHASPVYLWCCDSIKGVTGMKGYLQKTKERQVNEHMFWSTLN